MKKPVKKSTKPRKMKPVNKMKPVKMKPTKMWATVSPKGRVVELSTIKEDATFWAAANDRVVRVWIREI